MEEIIKTKLALNIAQLSLDKATLAAQNESLQETINQQSANEQIQAERIHELEKEVADLKLQLADVTVEEVSE